MWNGHLNSVCTEDICVFVSVYNLAAKQHYIASLKKIDSFDKILPISLQTIELKYQLA